MRRTFFFFVVIGLTWAVACGATGTGAVLVKDLKCEYTKDPLGIEAQRPRLSWVLESSERGQKQTAYRIQVSSSEDKLRRGEADLWDSGRVASDQSIQVEYAGAPLRSRQRCHWQVTVWDKGGKESSSSEPAAWEMGLLEPDDWNAGWIGYTPGWNGRALYFRYDIELPQPVRSARAYVAGLGYHEFRLNGRKVGDHVLDPGVTNYSKRVLYVTHDVTALLHQGKNTIGAIVGNGWYGMPRLLLQMEVTYVDGSTTRFFTHGGRLDIDAQWQVTSGPILSNSIYDGEEYDARLEKRGWDVPEAQPQGALPRTEDWEGAVPVEPPGGRLVSQVLEPIKVVETLRPASVREPKPGVFVFDTGQNLAGWARLRVRGERGRRVTLRFAENLSDDGTVNQENLRKAAATDVYILSGEGEETWEPRFTYHGFRYTQVEGFPGRPGLDSIAIKVVRSAVQPNSKFESSNALINRIQKMIWWTEASNLYSIPTDCPQRDERMGWMNDLTVRNEEALYNFDLSRFYTKFLGDIRDEQGRDGSITDTVPFKWGRRPADPVSASYLLLGWNLYRHYGDKRVLAEYYDGFKAWVDFIESKSQGHIVTYGSWGDWSPPAAYGIPGSNGAGAQSKDTPLQFMSTGYLIYTARLVSKMAQILGKEADAATYGRLADEVTAAFNRKYWDAQAGGYGTNNQASNAFALYIGAVPPAEVPRVVGSLVAAVDKADGHLTTGNLCTKYLLEMLSDHGKADVAYRIAAQQTYPGWGFMLKNGATTLWERWEHLTGGQMNSHNHPMMGSVSSWFYKYLAGIQADTDSPGFKRVIIRPYPVSGLEWVRAEYLSPFGPIRSSWKKEAGTFTLSIAVPVNATAAVHLPAGDPNRITAGGKALSEAPGVKLLSYANAVAVVEVESGSYEFEVR